VTFEQLLAHPGVEEVCELRSRFGFMAFHGGALEVMTDVIARTAAERAGASYYGVHQPDDLLWHLPSIEVDPAQSPPLARFLEHVDIVVTVHGYGRAGFWTTLLLGGTNRTLAAHLAGHLRTALPTYKISADMDAIPVALRGLHPNNPVNRPRQSGVQLELPPRVRGASPVWKDWAGPGPVPHTVAVIDALVAATASWPTTG
jgi:phage replication-related protein YjqB (UPF0714/DUF867 family)